MLSEQHVSIMFLYLTYACLLIITELGVISLLTPKNLHNYVHWAATKLQIICKWIAYD